jgi:hypothetical protein
MKFMIDDAKSSKDEPITKTRELRRKIKEQYGFLYEQVAEILCRYDPAYLTRHGAPPDEYEGETSRILPQLKNAKSVSEVRKIIYDVFDQSFNYGYSGSDLTKRKKIGDGFAGTEADYHLIAEEVWAIWKTLKSEENKEE